MRFGGHETFPLREGWLHKGLKLLLESPERLVEENAGDWLGVGRNMAKSIRHWLAATSLATPASAARSSSSTRMEPTDFGRLVWKHDPFFAQIGTWWALHCNLVNSPQHAAAWTWFFNSPPSLRFERPFCVEAFTRYLNATESRQPRSMTIQRDIACLLSSYSRAIPPDESDPEDAADSPFQELGIMTHFRNSGYYQVHDRPKSIPHELLGYSISRACKSAVEGAGQVDISIQELVRVAGGPGRVFVLSSEALFETALAAEHALAPGELAIAGLAGERAIRLCKRSPLMWLRLYYEACAREGRHAA